MNRIRFALGVAVGVLLVCQGRADSPSAMIRFSKDEQTVTVRRGDRALELVRPVVVPWKYKAKGQLYWVAPDGNDVGFGSEDRPFRTIQRAMQRTVPGDIVYVRPGAYVGNVVISHSGREGEPIVLSCAPGALGKVKITPSKEYVERNPGGAVLTVTNGARHVWINGLIIEGPKGRPEAPKSETYGANGITWSGKAGVGCRATNNVIYKNVHCGVKEMGHGGREILVAGNVIFDNGTDSHDHGIYMPASAVTMDGNIIFGNAGYGIHSYEFPKKQLITRNICFDHAWAGIILSGSENKAYHNVCVRNGIGIFYFRKSCEQNDVRNNIFAFNKTDCGYDNGGGKLGDPSKNNDDYNCYFPGVPDRRIQPGGHELLADPLFRDIKKGDFRLSPRSPCRDKGDQLGEVKQKGSSDLGAFVPTDLSSQGDQERIRRDKP
ncbi:MAG: NosD domain-containing protein [Gemmataceae bacterium]